MFDYHDGKNPTAFNIEHIAFLMWAMCFISQLYEDPMEREV